MKLAYFAESLNASSHVWMRRMLDMLKNEISLLVVDANPGVEFTSRFKTLIHDRQNSRSVRRRIWNRLLFRSHDSNRRLRDALKRLPFTSLIIHYLDSAVAFGDLWRELNKPVLVHCHGQDVTWNKRSYEGKPVHPADYVERVRELPRNVSFIANSKSTESRLLQIGIPGERIHVKYFGVELPGRIERTTEGMIQLLYLGRLVDFKGPDLLIAAFKKAVDDGLDARLVVAGDGPLRVGCELLAIRLGVENRVCFTGAVDELTARKLFSDSDIFTAHSCVGPLTGQEEAFGVAFLEAMAHGLPVVTGRSGGIPELVSHQETGILFEQGDVAGHSAALRRLAGDSGLRRQFGDAARHRVMQQFSLEKEKARMLEIIQYVEGEG